MRLWYWLVCRMGLVLAGCGIRSGSGSVIVRQLTQPNSSFWSSASSSDTQAYGKHERKESPVQANAKTLQNAANGENRSTAGPKKPPRQLARKGRRLLVAESAARHWLRQSKFFLMNWPVKSLCASWLENFNCIYPFMMIHKHRYPSELVDEMKQVAEELQRTVEGRPTGIIKWLDRQKNVSEISPNPPGNHISVDNCCATKVKKDDLQIINNSHPHVILFGL